MCSRDAQTARIGLGIVAVERVVHTGRATRRMRAGAAPDSGPDVRAPAHHACTRLNLHVAGAEATRRGPRARPRSLGCTRGVQRGPGGTAATPRRAAGP